MRSLSNQYLTIRVADHGAELSGIVANATGKEYLWQADPAFWKRHSPVLFPIVGSVWEGKYRQDGATYSLSQHGFARDRDFTLVHESENELRFALESDERTREVYPFDFRLEIGYRLEGNRIEVLWRVVNTGDRTAYFQIGAHPAFYYPNYDLAAWVLGKFTPQEQKLIAQAAQKLRHALKTEDGTEAFKFMYLFYGVLCLVQIEPE